MRIGMGQSLANCSEQLDGVLRMQADRGLLGGGRLGDAEAGAPGLVLLHDGVDADDADFVDSFDGLLDLVLGGARVDEEAVALLLIHGPRALLGEQWLPDDESGGDVGGHQRTSAFSAGLRPMGLILASLPVCDVGPLSQASRSARPMTR